MAIVGGLFALGARSSNGGNGKNEDSTTKKDGEE
jgi:hypothetical protein